jgi:alpha-tubulin suppressor-like RCC1 family protein
MLAIPISLDIGTTGLNLYPNAAYYFQVTATNNTGTNANVVSTTTIAPFWFKPRPLIAMSEITTYYVNTLGNMYGWGYNGGPSELLTNQFSYGQIVNTPTQITSVTNAIMASSKVYAYEFYTGVTCYLNTSYNVNCVGSNAAYQLGRGIQAQYGAYYTFSNVLAKNAFNPATSTPTASNSPAAASVGSATATHSGTGSSTNSSATVSTLSNIVQVAAGVSHVCALDMNQKIWCWGTNGNGQLQGADYTDPQPWAAPVLDNQNYLSVVAGTSHTCGLRPNHTIWCWGAGGNGQVGGGFIGSVPNPTVITDSNLNTITDFVDISAGDQYTCGLRSDGSMWCWGYDNADSLANGNGSYDTTYYATYSSNFTTNDIISIGNGSGFGCVLRRNGQVWCWGSNGNGQIGQPNQGVYYSALQIQSWTDVIHIAISSDAAHVCAIRQDSLVNSLWCWGDNSYSQLGAGSSPTPGFTPTASNTGTSTNSVTPSSTPLSAGSATSTPSPTPSVTSSQAVPPFNSQYTPQYVSIPVM